MKKSLYLFQNGELVRKDNTILFKNEERQRFIPVENVNDIYIFGEVDVNKRFLEFASQKEICVHFFNYYGYYVGTFYPREHLNAGYVTIKQAEHYIDNGKRLWLAKAYVRGAIGQMQQVLKYYRNRVDKGRGHIETVIATLDEQHERLEPLETIEAVMAVEGNAREWYYSAFDVILGNPDFVFEKRSRRPPLNRLNALISFGNSICYTMVLSEIYKTFLDPRIGYLHASNFRRFTLNLDIAEIFKPIVVDRLIFTLINKRMVTKKDFDEQLGLKTEISA